MSDYAIKILKARCGEVDSLLAAAVAAEDQAAEQLAALERQVEKAKADALAARTAVLDLKAEKEGLQGDIARLQEVKPVLGAPELPPVPEARDPRTREPRGEPRADGRRYSRDPLHVNEKQIPRGKKIVGAERPRKYVHPEERDLDTVSPTQWERAELAYQILAEAPGGTLSQQKWGEELTGLLECKPQTGASILSDCIGILQTVKRVIWTGELENRSAVWVAEEQASPELRASAGLGTAEDNFAGKTSTPPTTRQMRGHGGEESSGFEMNRRRH